MGRVPKEFPTVPVGTGISVATTEAGELLQKVYDHMERDGRPCSYLTRSITMEVLTASNNSNTLGEPMVELEIKIAVIAVEEHPEGR